METRLWKAYSWIMIKLVNLDVCRLFYPILSYTSLFIWLDEVYKWMKDEIYKKPFYYQNHIFLPSSWPQMYDGYVGNLKFLPILNLIWNQL